MEERLRTSWLYLFTVEKDGVLLGSLFPTDWL